MANAHLRRLLRLAPAGTAALAAFDVKERALAAKARIDDRLDPPDRATVGWVPVPPARLRAKVAGKADARTFLMDGSGHHGLIWAMLAESGRDPHRAGDVLDFGCGCGRTLRWWPGREDIRLTATDLNPNMIAWCREGLPHVRSDSNELLPPTRYADGSFDVIYAISIFTHLSLEAQRAWLAEFDRLLRDGGCLIFTTCGDRFRAQLSSTERERFDRGEPVVQFGESEGSNLCGAFHPETYVREGMLDRFAVAAFRPGSDHLLAQDMYLVERPGPA